MITNLEPNRAVTNLLEILTLDRLEADRFRGLSPQNGWQRVYGGQVIGQAVMAASQTVPSDYTSDEKGPGSGASQEGEAVASRDEKEPRHIHSLHAYFLRPGDPKVPIHYTVERVRDGGSFSTRRVVAEQHDKAIFTLTASFQRFEKGYIHQSDMPDVPELDALMSDTEMKALVLNSDVSEAIKNYWRRERPIEFRPVSLQPFLAREDLPPEQAMWMRCAAPLPEDPHIHAAVVAYISDMTLLDTALLPHGETVFSPNVQAASLDHAMWFHRPFDAHEWLLFSQQSPSASNARGFTRGSLFAPDGTLVASVAQEGLIRPKRRKA